MVIYYLTQETIGTMTVLFILTPLIQNNLRHTSHIEALNLVDGFYLRNTSHLGQENHEC